MLGGMDGRDAVPVSVRPLVLLLSNLIRTVPWQPAASLAPGAATRLLPLPQQRLLLTLPLSRLQLAGIVGSMQTFVGIANTAMC